MRTWIILAGLLFVGLIGLTAATAEEPMPVGQQAFLDVKCNMCHAVSTVGIESRTKSEKMKGPDLVNLAKTWDAKKLTAFMKQETEVEGEKHKEFKGTDEELQALVDWLLEQKAE